MKICQVRHARGEHLNEFDKQRKFDPADQFVTEAQAARIVSRRSPLPYVKHTARVLQIHDVNVALSPVHEENAPIYEPRNPFRKAAVCAIASPQEEPAGYPERLVTIILNGRFLNARFVIMRRHDSYTGFDGVRNHFAWALSA